MNESSIVSVETYIRISPKINPKVPKRSEFKIGYV